MIAGCAKKEPAAFARDYVEQIRLGNTDEARKMHCAAAAPSLKVENFQSPLTVTDTAIEKDRACIEGSVAYDGTKGSVVAINVWTESRGPCIKAVHIYGSCKPNP